MKKHASQLSVITGVIAMVLALVSASVPAMAADKYWSGAGTWDTTPNAWGSASGVYGDATWDNAAPDSAIFEGTGGTVTLGEAITAANMTFSSDGYTIDPDGNTLTIGANGKLTADADNIALLSEITRAGTTYLDGTGSGSVSNMLPNSRIGFYKDGTGSWAIDGWVRVAWAELNAGDLVVNGTLYCEYRRVRLYGGATLHYNSPGAVKSTHGSYGFYLYDGSFLDNTSGGAITTAPYSYTTRWLGDWTFLGSGGVASDLYLGDKMVLSGGTRAVTVSNALTTLTIGGVIDDGASVYGLTKAGAGTLKLTANNTYEGDTTVGDGVLSITQPSLPAGANVYVANSGVLNLDFVGTNTVTTFYTNGVAATPGGIWGPVGSGAANESAFLTGTGRINVLYGTPLDGVRYWDGGSSNIGSDGDGGGAGGAGTWSTSISNWDQGAGVAHTNWNSATNDMAIFKGTAGTVTLAEDITLGGVFVDTVDGYVITGNTLDFSAGGSITNTGSLTIQSAITGTPTVVAGSGETLTLAPTAGSMTLGTIRRYGGLVLGGTTTGNTVASIPKFESNGAVNKNDSGTWTVEGDFYGGHINVNAGTLVANGTTWIDYRDLDINSGGTFAINGTFNPRDNDPANLNSGGTMRGTGTFLGPISVPLNVKAGATLAPGYPTGTLTITNASCTVNGNLSIAIDDTESPKNGTLDIYGTLDISAGTLDFSVTGTATNSEYVLARYTTLTGQFAVTNNLPTGYSIEYNHNAANQIVILADTNAPTPDPMGFAVAPAAISPSKIVMTASPASDPSGGIEYYFENTTNSSNSGWQSGSVWTNSSLTGNTTYGYRVKARDLFGNETGWSTPDAEATTLSADNDAPTPDEMTWSSVPAALNPTQVVMTATTAIDPSTPIQYYFTNTLNGDVSDWITSTSWTNSGLLAETTYSYRVKARDAALNETGWSTPDADATTPEATPPAPSPMVFEVLPAAFDHTRIVMTATNANDPSGGIEYYFENTTNGNNSGWITGQVWTNTGLTLGSNYGYRVKARDVIGNQTDWSDEATAAPAYETTPPEPSPMTFAVAPAQLGADSIVMTATIAIDALSPPVEYFFKNTTNNNDSGWISSTVWTNTSLPDDTYYGYTVTARDALSNETVVSSEALVFLPRPPITVYWDGPNTGGAGDGDGASQGGTATWSTSVTNWDDGTDRVTWYNGSDTANLGGSAGTVTLGEAISLSDLNISTAGYTIQSNTLTFAPGSTIANTGVGLTIESGITGSPTVNASQPIAFAPTTGSVTLGTGSGNISFGGSTTGNSVAGGSIRTVWNGTGEWTLTGYTPGYTHIVESGTLIINPGGTLKINNRSADVRTGATLHYNTPGAITDRYHASNGSWRWIMNGGTFLDNSSGAAITTSTYNPSQWWKGDWTFIGTNGALSDLYLGTGRVGLDHAGGDVTVTVQDADTTLTVGGVIGDDYSGTGVSKGYGLTKAGPGTLALTDDITYTGDTIVNAGTLKLTGASTGEIVVNAAGALSLGDGATPSDLNDVKALRIAAGATVELDFVGTDDVFEIYTNGVLAPGGTWGALGSGADNQTALITGAGLLNVPVAAALEGVRYWDGGTTNIAGTGNSLSDGGDGTWNATTSNWDCGAGVAYTNWNNATNDLAILGGTAGTVTLAEDISLGALFVDTVDGYVIESSTLAFAAGGAITNSGSLTIRSGITGSPTVVPQDALTLAPTAGTMTIGAVPSGHVRLDGTTTGNTVASIGYDASKYGTGTWTVLGDLSFRLMTVDEGTLIVEGACSTGYRYLDLKGGTLVIKKSLYHGHSDWPLQFTSGVLTGTGWVKNNGGQAVTVPVAGTLAPGYPTGTLAVTNIDCTVNGTLAITIDGDSCGTLAVDPANTLDISNAALEMSVSAPSQPNYVIARYGTLTGTFASISGLPSNWRISYNYMSSNTIAVGPPPASVFLFR